MQRQPNQAKPLIYIHSFSVWEKPDAKLHSWIKREWNRVIQRKFVQGQLLKGWKWFWGGTGNLENDCEHLSPCAGRLFKSWWPENVAKRFVKNNQAHYVISLLCRILWYGR